MLRAQLLTIGDEILIGQIVDTNAAWLGEKLTQAGVDVARTVSLGDEEEAIRHELDVAFSSSELVVMTGGLGATHDDITRAAVAAHFGVTLREDSEILSQIEARFRVRGRSMPPQNAVQALVPEGFEVLRNYRGTAPGLWHTFEQEGVTKTLAILPGVPHEMRELFQYQVLPRLVKLHGLRAIKHRTLLTAGIGETHLSERIGDLSDWLGPSLRLAFLPSTNGVRLRMTALGPDSGAAAHRLDLFEAFLREKIDHFVYGYDDDTLEGVVGHLLADRRLTIVVAESCTGGHILNRLTNVAGSSRYVLGGIIAYCNNVKIEALGVPEESLERDGAVSESVACAMAENARQRLGADVGLSTTGVAGPGGGTSDKPVGLIWIGLATEEGVRAQRFQFVTDRIMNKELSSTTALDMVRRALSRLDDA